MIVAQLLDNQAISVYLIIPELYTLLEEYISPLTTDINEVLLSDNSDYYLTWE